MCKKIRNHFSQHYIIHEWRRLPVILAVCSYILEYMNLHLKNNVETYDQWSTELKFKNKVLRVTESQTVFPFEDLFILYVDHK